jgi:hypothetical protein
MSELKTGLIVLSCIIVSTFAFYRLTKATDTAAYNAPTQWYTDNLSKNNKPNLELDNEYDDKLEYDDGSSNSTLTHGSVGGTRRHRKRKSKSKRRRK